MTMHKYSDLILRGALPNTIQEAQECHNTARTCKNLPQENMQVADVEMSSFISCRYNLVSYLVEIQTPHD